MKIFLIILSLTSLFFYSLQAGEIFDDFEYSSSLYPVRGDSTGSVFGVNPWLTKDSVVHSRAWHRYNVYSPRFDKKAGVIPENGKLILFLLKGEYHPLSGKPMIVSGFLLDHGTISTRIKFADLPSQAVNQAYWLTSPLYYNFYRNGERIMNWDEMDFEWNNTFLTYYKYKDNMAVGCNNYTGKQIKRRYFDFYYFNEGEDEHIKTLDLILDGKKHIHDKWYICTFVLDSVNREVSFYMRDDDSTINGEIIGISHYEGKFRKGFTIKDYYPKMPVSVVYSNHAEKVKRSVKMEVDWFYFLDEVIHDQKVITENVKKLREKEIKRLNTTDKEIFHDHLNKEDVEFYIKGPDTLENTNKAFYSLSTNYKLWAPFICDFKYRFISGSSAGNWINIYNREIEIEIPDYVETVDLKLIIHDDHSEYRDTIHHKTIVKNEIIEKDHLFDVSIHPNPAKESFQIILDVYNSGNYSLKLYDLRGKEVRDFGKKYYQKGRYEILADFNVLSNDVYYLAVRKNNKIITRKILKFNY